MRAKAHHVWIEILVVSTTVAILLALLFSTIGAAAGLSDSSATATDGPHSFEGMVTCSRCGAKHSAVIGQTASSCVRLCVHGGAHFALIGASSTYLLDGDAVALKRAAGQRAKILGTLAGETIKVTSVTIGS